MRDYTHKTQKYSDEESKYIRVTDLQKSLISLLKLEGSKLLMSEFEEKLVRHSETKLRELVGTLGNPSQGRALSSKSIGLTIRDIYLLTKPSIKIHIRLSDKTRKKLNSTEAITNDLCLIYNRSDPFFQSPVFHVFIKFRF